MRSSALSLLLLGCHTPTSAPVRHGTPEGVPAAREDSQVPPPEATGTAGDSGGRGDTGAGRAALWTLGALSGALAPAEALQPLPGGLSGVPIWVSNNPETVRGAGWLMQSSRTDSTRGGERVPLTEAVAYLFHTNGTGQPRWLQLVATNPQSSAVTVESRGVIRTNQQHPLSGPASGPSYAVAEAWLRGELDPAVSLTLAPSTGGVLASASLPAGSMVDGRYAVSASAGILLYTVLTTSASAEEAINATQGAAAAGDLAYAGPDTYGREAGVYAASVWEGAAQLALPEEEAWLAFALNTDSKFAWQGVTLPEMTAEAVMHLSDSAPRTWGCYGHRLELTLELSNPGPTPRTVEVTLGSHYTSTEDVPSFTWSAPVRVDGEVVSTWQRKGYGKG